MWTSSILTSCLSNISVSPVRQVFRISDMKPSASGPVTLTLYTEGAEPGGSGGEKGQQGEDAEAESEGDAGHRRQRRAPCEAQR